MKTERFGMIKISEKCSISIFFFVSLFLFFSSQSLLYSLIFILSAAIHEGSHVFFLLRYGAQIHKIAIYPFGIDMQADTRHLSYKKELVCTLSGSFSNLLFALFGYALVAVFSSPEILFFVLCNLFLGFLNLIPLSFFDGGKALRLILYDTFDIDRAFYLHKTLDILSALLFLTFGVFIMIGSDFNLSVCAAIVYSAISTLAQNIKCSC